MIPPLKLLMLSVQVVCTALVFTGVVSAQGVATVDALPRAQTDSLYAASQELATVRDAIQHLDTRTLAGQLPALASAVADLRSTPQALRRGGGRAEAGPLWDLVFDQAAMTMTDASHLRVSLHIRLATDDASDRVVAIVLRRGSGGWQIETATELVLYLASLRTRLATGGTE
jgi:hypothetical protein